MEFPKDYGDAPIVYGIPSHQISGNVYLGNVAAAQDLGHQPSANADGDDTDGTSDEDGVSAFPVLSAGDTSYTLPKANITAAGSGTLHAWIDFDGDGLFESTEYASTSVSSSIIAADLSWAGQSTMSSGVTYARLRFTSDSNVTASTPASAAADGEVEDYALTVGALPDTPSDLVCSAGYQLERWTGTIDSATQFDSDNDLLRLTVSGENFEQSTSHTGQPGVKAEGANTEIPVTYTLSYINAGMTNPESFKLQIVDIDSTGGDKQDYVFMMQGGSAVSAASLGANMIRQINPAEPAGQIGYQAIFNSGNGTTSNNNPWHVGYQLSSITDGMTFVVTSGFNGNGTESIFDYQACVASASVDYGDAPISGIAANASGTNNYGAASHTIISGIYLGAGDPDADSANQPTTNADGDDSDGSNDDDGITFPSLAQGSAATITADVTGSGGYLQGWIDWNGDGDFADSGEQVATDLQLGSGASGTINVPVTVPSNAVTSQTFARFRWSTTSGLDDVTAAPDGEVEDYAVTILAGAPPFPPGPGLGRSVCSATTPTGAYDNRAVAWEHNSPANTLVPTIYESTLVTSAQNYVVSGLTTTIDETFVHVDTSSIGSAYDANKYFEYQFKTTALTGGTTEVVGVGAGLYEITQASHSSKGGHYRFAVLIDDDPAFASPDVLMNTAQIKDADTSVADVAWGPFDITHSIFHYAHYDVNGSTVQLAPNTDYKVRVYPYAVSATGSSVSGVVTYPNFVLWDDFSIKLATCSVIDYSDAPVDGSTAPNGTDVTAYGEAMHSIVSELQLGAAIDADGGSINSPSATGDGVDDDGITTFPVLTPDSANYQLSVTASNTTGNPGRLIAWIDFDGNGRFDADEAGARVVPTGTTNGSFLVTWANIPVDIQAGNTFLRVRLTTDALNAGLPSGVKPDGEVEDYTITIGDPGTSISGRVYVDANSNAIEDIAETGIGNTVIVLRDTATGVCRSTTTNGNGGYRFTGIVDSSYEIYQAHGETTPIPQSCGVASANNPTGYQSTTPDTLTVTVAGSDITGQDFGEVAGTNSPTSGNSGVGIAFEPDHQSEVLPGNVAFYAHSFTSEAEGGVRFTSNGSGNSASGWTQTLYRDANCDGTLNGTEGDTPINGINFGIPAGGRVCLIDKVYVPSNVPAQDRYEVNTTATFTYAGGSLPPAVLTVTDITTAGQTAVPASPATPQTGESRLELTKAVENTSQGTPETETLNQAKPGDFLIYRIYYRNTGTGPITDLKVNDVVPDYTGLVGGSNVCNITPTGMTCTPNLNVNELDWAFTGSLMGGAEGHVSYEVMVDN